MKKGIFILMVCLVVAVLFAGCAEVKYGGAKMTRLGDSNTEDLYAEHFTGPLTITVDPNTGLHNYQLVDANSTYTRFSFGSSVSEGRLPIEPLASVISEAVIAGIAGP